MNKAILIGNLGKDPETSHTEHGTTIANFTIATTDSCVVSERIKNRKRLIMW